MQKRLVIWLNILNVKFQVNRPRLRLLAVSMISDAVMGAKMLSALTVSQSLTASN